MEQLQGLLDAERVTPAIINALPEACVVFDEAA